jgi:hypothetical protein
VLTLAKIVGWKWRLVMKEVPSQEEWTASTREVEVEVCGR